MNNETIQLLEQHFDTAFAAPNGIKKLRELILTLAMQGKLVPQDPNDQPASELLKEIEAEKKRLVKEEKIKPQKPLPEIKQEEVPYELPKSWEWVRLGNIGIWKSGTTPSRTNSAYYDGEIPWVKSGEVKQGKIRETEEKINQEALNNCSLDLNPIGSILIAMYGANIGEVGVLEIEATTNQAICACKTYSGIDNIFLLHLITSLKQNFIGQGAGAAQPNISREKIINTVIPLPPLREQYRIVAKIDQLMARCDDLEKLRSERDQKRITVHTVALNHLLIAKESNNFRSAWNFITQNFGELYSVKENVAELRKAILQLAVMGKLVPQDPNDQPASELLKEIEAEKKRLLKEGKIKAQKPLPEIKPEEVPYRLPKGWEWSNIKSISLKVTDGEHITPQRTASGYYLLSARNITNEGIKLNDVDYVPHQEYERIRKRCDPEIGDILVSCLGSVGRVAIVDANDYVMVRSVALIKYEHNLLKPSFFANAMKSLMVQSQIIEKSRTTAQSNLFLGKINEILIPLPPLAEQHRIVTQIDQLMNLCDELEKQIAAATSKQTDLLNAVMTQV